MKVSIPVITIIIGLLLCLITLPSCQKEPSESQAIQQASAAGALKENGRLKPAKAFSSEVAQKWQDLQLRMLYQPQGVNPYGLNGVRNFAYTSIALYEAVISGMPSYQSLYGQLNDLPEMPSTEPGKAYHWPAVANAALAYMNRHFYTAAN